MNNNNNNNYNNNHNNSNNHNYNSNGFLEGFFRIFVNCAFFVCVCVCVVLGFGFWVGVALRFPTAVFGKLMRNGVKMNKLYEKSSVCVCVCVCVYKRQLTETIQQIN